MMDRSFNLCSKAMLLAGILAGGIFVLPLGAQSSAAPAAKPAAPKPTAASTPSINRVPHTPRREQAYYSIFWGVDSFNVKAVESGELIRFSYRIVDAARAKALNDKQYEPLLIDPSARVKLVVPSLEKIGLLRQSSTPIAGNTYWMAFSNPGRPVKKGDRVNIEIGQFHVDGLVVQ